MAYFSKFILALLLATATISMVAAQGVISGLIPTQVSQVDVLGLLVCSSTGTVLPGANARGIAGVNVHIECNNGTVDLGTLVTNTTGFFHGVLQTVDGVLFIPSTCVAQVELPIVGCSIFPLTGILQTALGPRGLISTLLGSIVSLLNAGIWQLVRV